MAQEPAMNSGISRPKQQYKEFPPGLGHIKVPVSSRQASSAALALYSACRTPTTWMQRIAIASVRLFGARILPGPSVSWSPPMGLEIWGELVTQWQGELGEFQDAAIHERRQSSRPGVALLLINDGRPLAFVKVRFGDAASAHHEYNAMRDVWAFQPRSFAIPKPIAFGSISNWTYLATSTLPSPEHRVARNPPLSTVLTEISAGLGSLPRPAGTPDHWLPMHGDFTPWNLREVADSKLILYDWEDAGWGPPQADDVLYRASYAAVRNTRPHPHCGHEAIQYWHARVTERQWSNSRDRRLARAIVGALERMQSNG